MSLVAQWAPRKIRGESAGSIRYVLIDIVGGEAFEIMNADILGTFAFGIPNHRQFQTLNTVRLILVGGCLAWNIGQQIAGPLNAIDKQRGSDRVFPFQYVTRLEAWLQ